MLVLPGQIITEVTVTNGTNTTNQRISNNSNVDKISSSLKYGPIILILAYIFIGALLGIVYSWINDGNFCVFIISALLLPVLFVNFFIAITVPINSKSRLKLFRNVELIFLIALLISPTMIKILSRILTITGNNETSHFFYNHRFISLVYIAIIYVMYSLYRKITKKSPD